MNWTYVGSAAGLAGGWFLNELSQAIRLRRDDRRAAGRILADLLEIRFALLFAPKLGEVLREMLGVPPESELQFRNVFRQLFPEIDQLPRRYNDGIDALAGKLPLLAYRLRSRDKASPMLAKLRELAATDPSAHAFYPKIEDTLVEAILPDFDELILELAKMHGRQTSKRTHAKIREGFVLPNDLKQKLAKIVQDARAIAKGPE